MLGYTTGPNNQLLSDGTYDYEYDAEGNRTKKTAAKGHYVTYTWDHRNRLVEVKFFDDTHTLQKSVAYGYDALNRRVWKEVDDDGDTDIDRVERYVYDAAGKRDGVTDVPLDDVALTFDLSGSLSTRALHGPAIDQLFASEDVLNDETFWSLTDHQGTVRDIATYNADDDETKVINHITYTTFGQITAEVDPSNNAAAPTQASLLDGDFRQAYTGREYDADVELYYYRERWYDARLATFTNEDPFGFGAGDPNLTRYAKNDSLNTTDPSGGVECQVEQKKPTDEDRIKNIVKYFNKSTDAKKLFNETYNGTIRVKADNTLEFPAQWKFGANKTIFINLQLGDQAGLSDAQYAGKMLFELHNAAGDTVRAAFLELAEKGQASRIRYAATTEGIEWQRNKAAYALALKAVEKKEWDLATAKILDSNAKSTALANFKGAADSGHTRRYALDWDKRYGEKWRKVNIGGDPNEPERTFKEIFDRGTQGVLAIVRKAIE